MSEEGEREFPLLSFGRIGGRKGGGGTESGLICVSGSISGGNQICPTHYYCLFSDRSRISGTGKKKWGFGCTVGWGGRKRTLR